MIQGRDIVCISSIEWDFNWQGSQEMASRLAAAGNRVLFIENTGIRSPGLKDAGRIARRFRRWLRSLGAPGLRKVNPNLHIHSPLVLPPFGSSWGRRLNAKFFLRQVRHAGDSRLYAPPVGYLMQRNRLYMVRKHGRWYQQAFYVLYSSLVELPLKVLVRALQGHGGFARACVLGQIDGLCGRMGARRLASLWEGAGRILD